MIGRIERVRVGDDRLTQRAGAGAQTNVID